MTLFSSALRLVLLLPVSTAHPSTLTINLFVSETLGEATLVELLRETDSLHNLNILVRGMGARDTNLAETITRWQSRIHRAGLAQPIQINPVLFREQNIDQVPAMTLVVDGSTKLKALGVTHQTG